MQNFWEEFKKPIVIITTFFVLLFLYTKLAGPIPFYINSVNTTKTDLFSASGNGEVSAAPDQATISLGVTKTSSTVADAQKQSNTIANKLIEDLKKLGIEDKDIKTTNYSVNPNVQPIGIEPVFPRGGSQSGYEVTQNLDIKVKPIDKVNQVIDTATKDGANLVGGTNFTFSDDLQKSLEQKATQMAVDDAKSKAQTLSNAAGVRLGKIINVVSSTNNAQPVYSFDIAQKATGSETTPPTNVTPGQNNVNIGVTIYYETY